MDSNIILAHAIYVAFMLVGAVIIFYFLRNQKGVSKIDYIVAGLVPIWSGLAYFSIYLGQGVITLEERVVYVARYVDWVVTTPLLLFTLCSVAMFEKMKNNALVIGIISADIIMIVCGLIADLSNGMYTYIWFGIGVVAFIIIFTMVWGPIRQIAKGSSEELYKLYNMLAIYITLLWIGYPASFILGSSGLNLLPANWDVYLFIVLPILSKVGFSLLALFGLRKISSVPA